MTSTALFTCSIGTTDATAKLGLEIWLDDDQIFNDNHISSSIDFEHKFNDSDGEHKLKFILKNKTIEDTQVAEDGTIIKDACLTITNLEFEEIELGHTFIEQAVYKHDFNSTQLPVETKFFGNMGCNGVVSLKFSTPIYLWLLEHM